MSATMARKANRRFQRLTVKDAEWALMHLTRDEVDSVLRDIRIAKEECQKDDRAFLARLVAALSQLRPILVKVL